MKPTVYHLYYEVSGDYGEGRELVTSDGIAVHAFDVSHAKDKAESHLKREFSDVPDVQVHLSYYDYTEYEDAYEAAQNADIS